MKQRQACDGQYFDDATPVKQRPNLNKTYRRNEALIQKELIKALAGRRIGLRAEEICAQAKLSRPTFYFHCQNCDDALKRYELELIYEFQNRSLLSLERRSLAQKELIFIVLMNFIYEHQDYFAANFQNQDFYLLTILLSQLQSALLPAESDRKTAVAYIAALETVIFYWGRYEHFNRSHLQRYVFLLQHIPPQDWLH